MGAHARLIRAVGSQIRQRAVTFLATWFGNWMFRREVVTHSAHNGQIPPTAQTTNTGRGGCQQSHSGSIRGRCKDRSRGSRRLQADDASTTYRRNYHPQAQTRDLPRTSNPGQYELDLKIRFHSWKFQDCPHSGFRREICRGPAACSRLGTAFWSHIDVFADSLRAWG